MKQARPITPDELMASLKPIPQEMVDVIDGLIRIYFREGVAKIPKSALVECLQEKPNFSLGAADHYNWWNFSELYGKYGWDVKIEYQDQRAGGGAVYVFTPINKNPKSVRTSQAKRY